MLELIDLYLNDIKHLKLIDGDKVRDLLLDLRLEAYELEAVERREEAGEGLAGEEPRSGDAGLHASN